MKKSFLISWTSLLLAHVMMAQAPLDKAVFKQVVNDVKVVKMPTLEESKAQKGSAFNAPDLVETGRKSRAQLVAQDGTITRVGASTVFSFEPQSREIRLQRGSLLFNSPKGKGGGRIQTATASATVLGTTLAVSATADGGFKTLCMEGSVSIGFDNGTTQNLAPGQLTFVMPGGVPGPVVNFDLARQVENSNLINGFEEPLPSMDAIESETEKQKEAIENGELQETNQVVVSAASANQLVVVDGSLIEQNTGVNSDGLLGVSEKLRSARGTDLTITSGGTIAQDHIFKGEESFTINQVFSNTLSASDFPSGDAPVNTYMAFHGLVGRNITLNIPYSSSSNFLSQFDGATEVYLITPGTFKAVDQINIEGLTNTRTLKIVAKNFDLPDGSSGSPQSTTFSFGSGSGLSTTSAGLFSIDQFIQSFHNFTNSSGSLTLFGLNGVQLTSVNLQGLTSSNGSVLVESEKNINLSNSTLQAHDVMVYAQNSTNSGSITISNSAMLQGYNTVSVKAYNSLTINNSTLKGNPTSNNAITLRGNNIVVQNSSLYTLSLTAGGFQANGSGTLMQSTKISLDTISLSGLTTMNMAAKTIDLKGINFPPSSLITLKTTMGMLAPNPNTGAASQVGYVNFISGVDYNGSAAQGVVSSAVGGDASPGTEKITIQSL